MKPETKKGGRKWIPQKMQGWENMPIKGKGWADGDKSVDQED